MDIEIALPAHTILYLPLYMIEARNIFPKYRLSFVPANGDGGAYGRVAAGVSDLAVCDPMILAGEAAKDTTRPTDGIAVAALVGKTGLWGLSTKYLPRELAVENGLIEKLQQIAHPELGNAITYNMASTGGQALEFLVEHNRSLPNWDQFYCNFGSELLHVNGPITSGEKTVPMHLVLTCDLLGALACVDLGRDKWGLSDAPVRVVDLPLRRTFNDALFTVLVANRKDLELHDDKRRAVFAIVRAIQRILDEFYGKDPPIREMVNMLVRQGDVFQKGGVFQTVGAGRLFECDEDKKKEICKRALGTLREQQVVASSVRLHEAGWVAAYELWHWDEKNRPAVDPSYFVKCVDLRYGIAGDPSGIARLALRLGDGILRRWEFMSAMAAAFAFLGILAGLQDWHPETAYGWGGLAVAGIIGGILWCKVRQRLFPDKVT